MMILILTILSVWLLFSVSSLRSRVELLESQMTKPTKPKVTPDKVVPVVVVEPITRKKTKKSAPEMSLEDLLTKRVFPILGSLSLILAIAYFVVMAINNDWLGPVAQIGLATLVSLFFLVLGEKTRIKYPTTFAYLSAVGVAGLIMTTFAAQSFYGLTTPIQSLFLYCGEVGLGVWLALRYDRRELANLAILGGLLAPALIQSPDPSALGLMLFLAILAVAGFMISIYKRWPELLIMLLLGIIIYEAGLAATGSFSSNSIFYLVLIYGIHTLIGSGGFVRNIWHRLNISNKKIAADEDIMDIVVLIGSALLANFLGYNIFDSQDWNHFGLLVLLQAVGFWGLSIWSQRQGLGIYQQLCLIGALISVLFATLWEFRAAKELVIVAVLAAESLALAWGAKKNGDAIFNAFSLLAAVFALIFSAQVDGIWWNLLGVILSGAALFGSAHAFANEEIAEPLKAIMATLAGGMFLFWSSVYFIDWVEAINWPTAVYFLGMCIVPLALIYWSRYPRAQVYAWVGFGFFIFINLIGLVEYSGDLIESLSLLFLFLGTSSLISQWVKTDKKLPATYTKSTQIILLGVGFFHLLVFGVAVLDEPFRTLFWLATGLIALFIGLQKSWDNLRYAGLAMILLVITKLYVFDVWQWELWARFFAFSALGIALLLIAFYYQYLSKKK